jgi:hypothetical protein
MTLEEEISEYLRDTLDLSPLGVAKLVGDEDDTIDLKSFALSLAELINAQRNALCRLAREIDELRAANDEGRS